MTNQLFVLNKDGVKEVKCFVIEDCLLEFDFKEYSNVIRKRLDDGTVILRFNFRVEKSSLAEGGVDVDTGQEKSYFINFTATLFVGGDANSSNNQLLSTLELINNPYCIHYWKNVASRNKINEEDFLMFLQVKRMSISFSKYKGVTIHHSGERYHSTTSKVSKFNNLGLNFVITKIEFKSGQILFCPAESRATTTCVFPGVEGVNFDPSNVNDSTSILDAESDSSPF